ncbi:hypothetical protein IGI39_002093 [Enterococcus sp. AZ135]|uniref:helix-turn-helix transcriptional regulator n=1 Tax=unclassified Enterococcus TaxID=2608891 RepID=UPI003F1F945B
MYTNEIKRLRQRLKLSQQYFADSLGISRSHLSKVENGKKRMSLELVSNLKKTFHLDGGILPMEAKIDFLRIRFKIDSPEQVIAELSN